MVGEPSRSATRLADGTSGDGRPRADGRKEMRVRFYRDEDRENWDAFVKRSTSSTVYHLSGWKRIIEDCFGHRTHYLMSENDEQQIDGILPLVHLKSILFGSFMVSMPYFTYGGICSSRPEVGRRLRDEAIAAAQREQAEHVEWRETRLFDTGLAMKTSKVSMRLPLPPDADELWRSFPSKLRSQIRKPQNEGMSARIGRLDELDAFYRVFSINMRDLGTPVYPKRFFQAVLHGFPDTTWICSVYKDDEPVASGFLVGFKETLEIPWASSLRAYNPLSPNMLLYWGAMQFACDRGFRLFDFGRSTRGSGTYKFKEQWGAEPVPLYWYYWTRDSGTLPELNPTNPRYRAAIAIWKRLPVGLTTLLGPAIVRNLP